MPQATATLPDDPSGAVCIESGRSHTRAEDNTISGQTFYYVVQTINACDGNPGSNSAGDLRSAPACP